MKAQELSKLSKGTAGGLRRHNHTNTSPAGGNNHFPQPLNPFRPRPRAFCLLRPLDPRPDPSSDPRTGRRPRRSSAPPPPCPPRSAPPPATLPLRWTRRGVGRNWGHDLELRQLFSVISGKVPHKTQVEYGLKHLSSWFPQGPRV